MCWECSAALVVPLARNVSDSPDSNVIVYPGDTIVVRKADVVYVVGEVGRPSGFAMDSGRLTVLQVIALAGGTTKTAKLGSVRLLRKGPSGVSDTRSLSSACARQNASYAG